LNADRQKKDAESPLNYCRRLLRFRKQHPALVDGSIKFIDCPKDMLIFVRANEKESILCVFNLSNTEKQWNPEGAGAGKSKNCLFEFGGADKANPFTLPPLAGYIREI
jgi:alpha-glucosidase